MGYEFERPARVAPEIRRIVVERLDQALEQLSDEALRKDRAVAVHTARKDLKKARSALRLAKGNLTREAYRSGNDRLRDAAHELAAVRENDAMVGALSSLVDEKAPVMSDSCAAGAREWSERLRPSEGLKDVTEEASRAAAIIAGVKEDARSWALGYGSWEIIEPGLRRSYRRGRAGLAMAETDSDDETLHEWRKRVKDMWYSLRLLSRMWPEVLGAAAEEAHKVSELLGDHHDLGELAGVIEGGQSGLSSEDCAELLVHARAKQAELHLAALTKGRRIYAERPRRYSQRLEALWRAWEQQS